MSAPANIYTDPKGKDTGNRNGRFFGNIVRRPVQMISKEEKDEDWYKDNIDYLEWYGISQLRKRSPKLIKKYKLALGIMDKEDYTETVSEEEYAPLVDAIQEDMPEALELKYYPIIPVILNTILTEISIREDEAVYKAIDEISQSIILQEKNKLLQEIVFRYARAKIIESAYESGFIQPEDPQVEQKINKLIGDKEAIESLPVVQEYFAKGSRLSVEQWAAKMHELDVQRHKIKEQEMTAMLDLWTTGMEFWHIMMGPNDYMIEVWSPLFTFFKKRPNSKYVSDGEFIGHISLNTVGEVIDKYGFLMNKEDFDKLKTYASRIGLAGRNQAIGNRDPWDFYSSADSGIMDVSKNGSTAARRWEDFKLTIPTYEDVINKLFYRSEDGNYNDTEGLVRVSVCYWTGQKKIGVVTKITDNGDKVKMIVSEDYRITEKPKYNTTLIAEKNEETLIFGEHVEWYWVDCVYGGIKIAPSSLSTRDQNNTEFEPIYIGIGQPKPGELMFQFRDDEDNLFGAKMPVVGMVLSERSNKVVSPVDLMAPYQIGYNIVNNQITDILLDELGTVVMLDQNTLPKNNLGEDWGQDPYINAYLAMKKYGVLGVDSSIRNTETPVSFNHFQAMDLSQTSRLQSRIALAEYFKRQCMEVVGITPERLGRPIGQYESGSKMHTAIAQSYNVTEKYFIYHSDHLMPRLHDMRTNLLIYYTYTGKIKKRMSYLNSEHERIVLEMEPLEYLPSLQIYVTTDASFRNMMERLKMLAINNPNLGIGLADIGKLMEARTYSALKNVLDEIDKKQQERAQMMAQIENQTKEEEYKREASLIELKAEKQKELQELKNKGMILASEIRAAGFGASVDIDQSGVSDFWEYMDKIKKSELYQKQVDVKEKKLQTEKQLKEKELDIEEKKLDVKKQEALINKQIAQINKNKYDES